MYDIFIQLFIIGPIIRYFLKKGKPSHAIAILIALSGISIAYNINESPPNYYQLLNVETNAPYSLIKKNFLKLSKIFHPDHNTNEDANQQFDQIRTAYEVLSNPTTRYRYYKFGKENNNNNTDNKDERFVNIRLKYIRFFHDIFNIAAFYFFWVIFTFVFTIGKECNDGRYYSLIILFLILILETYAKIYDGDFLTFLLPSFTIFEKISILHSLYPSIINSCCLLSSYLYVDRDAEIREVLAACFQINVKVAHTLDILIQNLKKIKKNQNNNDELKEENTEEGEEFDNKNEEIDVKTPKIINFNNPEESLNNNESQSIFSKIKPFLGIFIFYFVMNMLFNRK